MRQEIIVQFKDHHFLVSDDIFIFTSSDLYDPFNLDTLDISNTLLCIVSPQKLDSSIYVLYVSNKFGILRVDTCNNKLLIKRERILLHILIRK
jgi:Leucine-rich repeat (LRR) protein